MADVIPSGPISTALDSLRTLLSVVPFFITWTNTDTPIDSIFTGEVGFPIVSVSAAGGVLTIETREPHTRQVGDVVTIEGASLGDQGQSIDGPQSVASITSTTFTAATSLPDFTAVTPDGAFVVPCVRPLAVIAPGDGAVHGNVIGTGGASVFSGSLDILLEADVSTAYQQDATNALTEARNAVGLIVQGLADTQGTADLMCLNRVELTNGPEFTAKPEQDDNTVRFERWRAVVHVTWGLES